MVKLADTQVLGTCASRRGGSSPSLGTKPLQINSGDTITWLPTSKGHNVHFIAGPEGWELPKKSKNNKEVSITFDTPGVYLYQCTPHASMGMIALVIVDGDLSNKDEIAKVKLRGKSKKKLKSILADL